MSDLANLTMPVCYVAGPYRALSREGVELNIRSALAVGLATVHRGWVPLVPHTNFAHLDQIDLVTSGEFWLLATLSLMRRCDAVVLAPGWERSAGATAEICEADRMGLPVFFSEADLPTSDEWAGFADNPSARLTLANLLRSNRDVALDNFSAEAGL